MQKSMLLAFFLLSLNVLAQEIPLSEHPRPDFSRNEWLNLNGSWQFAFDAGDVGIDQKWYENPMFDKKILVPFPWGSALSGVPDSADIAWYARKIERPDNWKGERTFLIIGASDWATDVWVDGNHLGRHEGGYMPFEFEVTDFLKDGKSHQLVVRADDVRRMFTLYGKQGYGNARGIWQTVYLETRGQQFVSKLRLTPDIDAGNVLCEVEINDAADQQETVSILIQNETQNITASMVVEQGKNKAKALISIPNAKWWSLENPNLYDVSIEVGKDKLHSYFGMRKVSVEKLPGTEIPYISLNGKPVYLQMALDQAYHEQGFYTFPTDEFMKNEVQMAKDIGLNGIRIHIKPEMPRKLYWADKLGLLVMADLPNSWGEPDEAMQHEAETTLRSMIDRDYNHPSIFSWIVFNETWGLFTKVEKDGKFQNQYLPKTQDWVASMYYLTKSLDQSRLVEDNSICCGRGHTETDIMSWHEYLPGWEWDEHLNKITSDLHEGSQALFEPGFKQGNQPNINSECGNVWGYEGSTGDVDWSYDYHRMLNTFRMFPQVAGWLYTEHHDVINEWNGYWRFDRSKKYTGFEEIHPGMRLNDLHDKYYISTGNDITKTVQAGEKLNQAFYLSIYEDKQATDKLMVSYKLIHTDAAGKESLVGEGEKWADVTSWFQGLGGSFDLTMPASNGLCLMQLTISDQAGKVLNRNFCHFEIIGGANPENTSITSREVNETTMKMWTDKSWDILDGKKICGAGKGYFDYELSAPSLPAGKKFSESYIVFEVSAKQLFDKDKNDGFDKNQDYMLGSRVSPSSNPNSYPMTDETLFSSKLQVSLNGKKVLAEVLPDDPADSRGVLSWHHQLKDRKLREAGSYGYLIKVPVSKSFWAKNKTATLKLESVDMGGLAIYGDEFGRYPIDINWVLSYK